MNITQTAMPTNVADELAQLPILPQDGLLDIQMKISLIKDTTGIDITKLHCRKTGQPIATVSLEDTDKLFQFYNITNVLTIIDDLDFTCGVDRRWLHTEPTQLNRLQNIDPHGFFVYCISIALRTHHQHYVHGKKEFKSTEQEKKS